MSGKRQPTLLDAWNDGRLPSTSRAVFNNNANVVEEGHGGQDFSRQGHQGNLPRTKARGRDRGTGVSRGRGRGRGRGAKSFVQKDCSIREDEDDEICQQALGQFELNTSELCKAFEAGNTAVDLPGFDNTAGQIWIYPTNRPVRDYQFQIVQTSLFHNTLVSLPTGLGKTFIAAVVMYNFHRWYPDDLIIFMAPTRPLVTQQLEACHNIVGIHPSKTVELTGQIVPKKREDLWKTKTVMFLTPQVLTSDLTRGACPAEKVRCIVVDEAHKALGQHAYAQVISMLSKKNTNFRVLALSATPGSDVAAVQQIFKNLLISRVELRSENSPDILPYIHDKQVEKVVVPLDDYLKSVYDNLIEVFQSYTGKLMKQNVLHGRDGSSFTKFQLLKSRDTFRQTLANKVPNYQKGYIEVDFATCISLSHAAELLLNHGLRSFHSFLQGIFNKEKGNAAVRAELKKNTGLQEVLDDLQQKLHISAENTTFNVSSTLFSSFSKSAINISFTGDPEDEPDYMLSHPKMKVLKEIILKHFTSFETKNETTRVMIFSQYRDSVQEIGNMLSKLGSLVKPMVFIGQSNNTGAAGKGLKQKDQVQVVQRFREGGFNVLVATCVGEEGLDIGEVDLIICFDASKSPTRLVQRMGRTGRQRQGRIVFLLTKGKEERNYSAGFSLQNSISKSITDPNKLIPYLYKFSPRMVPLGVEPQCFKMSIVLTSEQEASEKEHIVIDLDEDEHEKAKRKPSSSAPPKPKRKKPMSNKDEKSGKGISRTGNVVLGSVKTGNENGIKQCFDAMFRKDRKESREAVVVNMETDQDLESTMFENECLMNDLDIHEDRSDVFRDIFDVRDASSSIIKACMHIHLPPKAIEWLPAYNQVCKTSVMLQDFDLDCLKEKLDSFKAFPYQEHCRCGNVYVSLSEEKSSSENQFSQFSEVESWLKKPASSDVERVQDDFKINSNAVEDIVASVENPFEDGFIFDENDPFFDNNWMEECGDEKAEEVSKRGDETEQRKTPFNDSRTLEDLSPIHHSESFVSLDAEVIRQYNKPPSGPTSLNSDDLLLRLTISKPLLNGTSDKDIISKSKTDKETTESKLLYLTNISVFDKSDGEESSSCTGDEEDFLISQNIPVSKTTESVPFYPKKFQADRSPFKDDILLFEDDDDFDFGAVSSQQNGITENDTVIHNTLKNHDNLPKSPVLVGSLELLKCRFSTPPGSPRSDISELSPDLMTNHIKRTQLQRVSTSTPARLFESLTAKSNKGKKNRKRRKLNVNPYLNFEADASYDSSSGDDEMEEFDGLDDLDASFVDDEPSDHIDESQQVRYLKSVKDWEPLPKERINRPLVNVLDSQIEEEVGDYESDSFCIANDDDVEFADVGVFTQAMNVAKEEILNEHPGSAKGRQTRRQKQVEEANKRLFGEKTDATKKRRRIILRSDSSDEG